ncbi:MAG: PAS/PAC sensor signal transduction histidine [Geobacteraceae bacterium]|nr:MAG: PAS/PAC sensor signal transduction histidine [Geobacteraceae bacterium]
MKTHTTLKRALCETNQALMALFESSPLAIIAVDLDGTVAMWNPAAERVFGWSAKEAAGRHYPITSPENENEFWALREYALGGKRLDGLELRRKKKDGSLIDISLSAAPLYDAKGEVSGLMTVCDDITERKRAVEELRKWSDIFRHTKMGIVLGGFDSETLDLINPAYAEMHGYTIEELTCKPISDLYAPECKGALPDHHRMIMGKGHHIYESRHIRKDGTVFPVMVDAATVTDEEGKALYRIVNVQDITKRKQAEEALQRNEERFRSLIENALDVITILDTRGSIRFQSPSIERVLGYDQEELIGRSAFELIHPDDRGRAVEVFNQAILNPQQTLTVEFRFLHKDGSWRILEGLGKKLPDKGDGEGIVVNSREITERRDAEEEIRRLNAELEQRVFERTAQLAAANKELESFSYSVSHDLRAPLRHIEGFCQILLEENGDNLPPRGKDYLRRVRMASKRMSQLIDDLLNLSRVTRGELRRQTVNLSRMARDIAAEYGQVQPERRVTFKIADEIAAFGDPRLLRVVLDNLLGNAWKYTGKQEQATIEFGITEVNGNSVWFVRDDGVGFDMTYADKLFGTFQRLHRMDEFEGTGIGLATVKRIIHRHGGRVWAEGEVGKGATFYFALG